MIFPLLCRKQVVLSEMDAIFNLLSTDLCCWIAFQSFRWSHNEINWCFNLKTGFRLLEVPLFVVVFDNGNPVFMYACPSSFG